MKHSQATKDKIGKAHKGKTISDEQKEVSRKTMERLIAANGGFSTFKGKTHSKETKDKLSAIAKARKPSEYMSRVEAMWKARQGSKATPEQRETYRQARLKYMALNPQKLKETGGERQIKKWLIDNGISFQQQYSLRPFGHPYDFYIPQYNTLIEFDGTHHWDRIWFGVANKTEQEKILLLEKQMEKDAIENYDAGKRGMKIIRLRGWTFVGDAPNCLSLKEQLEQQEFMK